MPKGLLIVRAVVAEPTDRPRFDHWYRTEHLRDAIAGFGATRGWRAWSRTDPQVHVAFYEFLDVAKAESIKGRPEMAALVAEFDRLWGDRVTRTREVLQLAE